MSRDAVNAALRLLIGRLSDETWTEADDLNECDEQEAALILMCNELMDADVSITQEIYDRLREAARSTGLGDRPFLQLELLIRD
jgi:hypothetical protein